ncbi:ABC transporter permease [Chitinophaga ginsengisegetis]|uniref:ABC transporter permease n=1 Tax=Chitinophaga ginsengisegetis TaxID=393003 RepID=UPI00341E2EC3
MFSSYIKTAFRTITRNFSYTFLNVFGLTLSIAACLIIFLIVKNELSYDSFHKKADRTYRVNLHALDYNPSTSLAVVPALRNDFPELEQVSQYWYQITGLVKAGDTRYNEKGFAFADASFLQIFDYHWLAGDPRTALSEPNQVVLTRSIAGKYFGTKDPMGQVINLNNQFNLKVTGVIEDLPGNTSQPFVFLASYETIRKEVLAPAEFYNINGGNAFVVLPEHYNVAKLQARMPAFITKNWGADVASGATLLLQPLKEIHFDQRYLGNPASPTTSRETYWGLAMVALFIIITACINFINMATAQAIRRAKEVGVRKVLGAYRGQLIRQFLGETTLLVLMAVVLGTIAAGVLLPFVATWMNLKIGVSQLMQPLIVAVLAAITVTVILLAGLYPAFVQSAFEPATSLKSNTGITFRGLGLRKILVSTQFGISQILIAGTLIVGYQMDFLQNQDLGFNKDAVVSFPVPDRNKRDILKEQLLANPGVAQLSFASGSPVNGSNFSGFRCPAVGLTENDVTEVKAIDEQYMDMFSIQLLAGEKIRPGTDADTLRRVLVNETMIHKMGIQNPEKALGIHFYINDGPALITGVVKDFQSESRYKKRRPCILEYNARGFGTANIRIKPTDMRNTIAGIDKLWSALFTENQFEYQFLDDRIASMYIQEQKIYTAFKLFSSLAIIIGCLGLYGLVAFAAVQRTKEVGIRKVLGASLLNIVGLFAKEFILLIFVSFCVAAPVAWFVMTRWLDNFAYQTHIGGGTFLIAISVSVLIAGVTIAYQSVKAGLVNPVKSLRA